MYPAARVVGLSVLGPGVFRKDRFEWLSKPAAGVRVRWMEVEPAEV